MPMNRRHWLAGAASAAALGTTTRLWAAPGSDARLLVVFLRGAYDALSLLVPQRSQLYAEARRNIAIPIRSATQPGGATPLDADWALHPSLQSTVLPLARAGQAVFVPFAGIDDDVSRSHFETQDAIELGQPLDARRDFQSGFLNRLAAQLGARGPSPIAFTDQLPLVLRGKVDVANVSLRNAPGKAGADSLQAAIASMYRGHPLQAKVEEAFAVRLEVSGAMNATRDGLAAEMESASRSAISAKGFEGEARRVARVMREKRALGFIDIGGWDTHVGQGGVTGYLASRLEELGRGLAAFADELGPSEWRRTVVVVLSEFGRTVRENGGRGTDHGHGSVWWVLGGGLAAGRPVTGEQLPVEASTLFQNRDLPVLNDYRSLLGGLMARLYALPPSALAAVFPGAMPIDLHLV